MRRYSVPEARIYDDASFDQLADNDAVGVVYIVLPNGLHARYTVRALKAGKHVMCEKPMANTVEKCRATMDTAKAADCTLMNACWAQFEPRNQRALQMKKDGAVGDVRLVIADTTRPRSTSRARATSGARCAISPAAAA